MPYAYAMPAPAISRRKHARSGCVRLRTLEKLRTLANRYSGKPTFCTGQGAEMRGWTRLIQRARPVAPGPALMESARKRAWADFVGRRRDPYVVPSVLDSWVRSRGVFHLDPALAKIKALGIRKERFEGS